MQFLTLQEKFKPISKSKYIFDIVISVLSQLTKTFLVQIFTGEDDSGTAIHTESEGFTGNVDIQDISSETGRLYITFKSDASENAAGFNMSFSVGRSNLNCAYNYYIFYCS